MPQSTRIENRLNLNGEFLGITSMAAYSAPWYLQVPLLILVGMLFSVKVSQESRTFKQDIERLADVDEEEDYVAFLGELNRLFFGFTVAKKNLAVYWIGFTIFLITLIHALLQTIAQAF